MLRNQHCKNSLIFWFYGLYGCEFFALFYELPVILEILVTSYLTLSSTSTIEVIQFLHRYQVLTSLIFH